jgi:hypothetical protein
MAVLNDDVKVLKSDFKNGLLLIHLVEALSGKTIPKYIKNPTTDVQMRQNLTIVRVGEKVILDGQRA